MSTKYIKFDNRTAEAAGLVALARRTRVDALPGGIYRVCEEDLSILEELELGFRSATSEEARQATEGVRNTVAARF